MPESATLIRTPLIASWREIYAATYPVHRLSWNKWLTALLASAIEDYTKELVS